MKEEVVEISVQKVPICGELAATQGVVERKTMVPN
jgi:hypothetical protein